MGGDGTGEGTGDDIVRIGPPEAHPAVTTEPASADAGAAEAEQGGSEPEGSGAGAAEPAEPGRREPGPEEPAAVHPVPAGTAGSEQARSALAAVLLNLTGFGLGYLYLRRWLRAAACIVIALLLVVVAFTNDAASSPWLWRVLAALWVATTAFDAWWVARCVPRPATWGRQLRPVAVGLVAVLAVVAGYVGYGTAGRSVYAAGVEAQGRADCAAGNGAFAAVTGPFELTLSRDVPAADARRAECTEYLAAESAERAGAHADAVAGYRDFRREHPGSPLEPFAREGSIRALLAWAGALRGSGDLDGVIDRYRDLLGELGADPRTQQAREDLAATYVDRAAAARETMAGAAGQARVDALRAAMQDLLLIGRELPDTPSAAGAAQAVLDTFTEANSAVAAGRFCDALPVLDYAVTLPESAGVAAVAHADRARSLSGCGLASYDAGDLTRASDRFATLVAEYPDDPGVPQARSALIAAEVGRSASVPLPLPAPLGAPGSEPVVVYNAAATEVRVLVTGPTAHEITLPPCPGCPPAYVGGAESCPGAAGMPSTTIQLRPGAYYVLQDRAELGPDESVDVPITVEPGGGELCVTVTRD